MHFDYSLTPKKFILGKVQTRKKILKYFYGLPPRLTFLGSKNSQNASIFHEKNYGGVKKYFFDVSIFNIFVGPFSRVNTEIPNAKIFKHTILKLSYEMYSKNIRHTFETFFFSQIQLRDTVHRKICLRTKKNNK